MLNSIDAEVLANKINSVTSNLYELTQPLQSSLSALGTNQWLLSDILPQRERITEKYQQLIVDALAVTQINVSLVLSCIQAQLQVQSTVATIIREGEEGTLPTEIWDNATKFEREFQSWWQLVNFTYNPTNSKATAFVLSISNASVYTLYPIIALGLNHNGTVLLPLEHRVWAQQKKKRGKLLILLHVLCGNNRDLFVKVILSRPKTFVLTQNKMFVTLKYTLMKPLKLHLYVLEMDAFV